MSLRKIEILMTPKGCVVQSVNPHELSFTIQNCTDSAITLVPLTNYCRFKDSELFVDQLGVFIPGYSPPEIIPPGGISNQIRYLGFPQVQYRLRDNSHIYFYTNATGRFTLHCSATEAPIVSFKVNVDPINQDNDYISIAIHQEDLNIVCENVLQMLTLTAEQKDWNDLSLNRVEPVLKSTKYLKFCDRLLHDMEKFIPFDIWNYILDVIQAIFPNVNAQVLRDIGDSENQQEIIDIDDKEIQQFEEGSSQLHELFLRVRTTLCSVFQLCLPHLIRLGEMEKDPFLSYNGTVRPAFKNFIKSQYPRIISYAINYTNDEITIEVTGKISEQEFFELMDRFVDREKCSLLTPVVYRIFSQQDDLLCRVSPQL